MRTMILMNLSNKHKGIVVGTGDLSESALGWCTFNGDHMSMYHVNVGVPKTLVKYLVDTGCEKPIFAGVSDTLQDILDTPISPELLPLDSEGVQHQDTEAKLGSYDLHDFILYHVVRFGRSPCEIFALAIDAFEGVPKTDIADALQVFYQRFFRSSSKDHRCPMVQRLDLSRYLLEVIGECHPTQLSHYGLWSLKALFVKGGSVVARVSVIGLGKLGASMAAGFASRGFEVVGYDINEKAVNDLDSGVAPVQETDLQKYISKYSSQITATTDLHEVIRSTDISFVVIPTPSEPDGSFSLAFARSAFKSIGSALKEKDHYHVIVMTSTVLPGSTRGALIPLLERESGKVCGEDFGVCYNPEFIALGSVIRDFLNPDFYLLGEFDKKAGDMLEAVHLQVSNGNSPVKRMTIENAELAKVALNSFVTLKVSFANMLAEFSEKLPFGNVDDVSDALGMDSRIGRKYLTGGLGLPDLVSQEITLRWLIWAINWGWTPDSCLQTRNTTRH